MPYALTPFLFAASESFVRISAIVSQFAPQPSRRFERFAGTLRIEFDLGDCQAAVCSLVNIQLDQRAILRDFIADLGNAGAERQRPERLETAFVQLDFFFNAAWRRDPLSR